MWFVPKWLLILKEIRNMSAQIDRMDAAVAALTTKVDALIALQSTDPSAQALADANAALDANAAAVEGVNAKIDAKLNPAPVVSGQ